MKIRFKKTMIALSIVSGFAASADIIAFININKTGGGGVNPDPNVEIGCEIEKSLTRSELLHKIDSKEDVTSVNTSCIKDFSEMFSPDRVGAPSDLYRFSQDIGNWNVSSGENFNKMFHDQTSFEQDLSNWNMKNALDVTEMFLDSSLLPNAKLNDWHFKNKVNLNHIFKGAMIVGEVNNWTIEKNDYEMANGRDQILFYESRLVNGSTLNNWSISGVDGNSSLGSLFYNSTIDGELNNWNMSNFKNLNYLFIATTIDQNALVNGWVIDGIASTGTDLSSLITSSGAVNGNMNNWTIKNFSDLTLILNASSVGSTGSMNGWTINSNNENAKIEYMFNSAMIKGTASDWSIENYAFLSYVFNVVSFDGSNILFNNWTFESNNKEAEISYLFNVINQSNVELSGWNIHGFTNLEYLFNSVSSSKLHLTNWIVDSNNIDAYMGYIFNAFSIEGDINNFKIKNFKKLETLLGFSELDLNSSINGFELLSNNPDAEIENLFDVFDVKGTFNDFKLEGYKSINGFLMQTNIDDQAITENWMMDSKKTSPSLTKIVESSAIYNDISSWKWLPLSNDYDKDGIYDLIDLDIDNDGALNAIEEREGTNSFDETNFPSVYYHSSQNKTVKLDDTELIYLDAGGLAGNYEFNMNASTTFEPKTIGNALKINIEEISLMHSVDYLKIYNGKSTSDDLIVSCTYNTCTGKEYFATNQTGSLTVSFESNHTRTDAGWVATISEIEIPQTDTDGDGVIDFYDEDDDGDRFSDKYEMEKGTDPLDKNNYPMDANHSTSENMEFPAINGFKYYDDGGNRNDYSNNVDFKKVTFSPSSGNIAVAIFNDFSTELKYDYLNVYNGSEDSESNLLKSCHGTICDGLTLKSLSSDGKLTFVFNSDSGGSYDGWDITIGSQSMPQTDTDGDGVIDYLDDDDDNDGYLDLEEIAAGTDPLDATDFPVFNWISLMDEKCGILNHDTNNDKLVDNYSEITCNSLDWDNTDGSLPSGTWGATMLFSVQLKNNNLGNVDFLNGLKHVDKGLNLNNSGVKDLSGLSTLETVGGTFVLAGKNVVISDYSPLSNINTSAVIKIKAIKASTLFPTSGDWCVNKIYEKLQVGSKSTSANSVSARAAAKTSCGH